MRILSGTRSTGKLHLGHYITIQKWVELQNAGNECFYFVADWHGLTTHIDSTENFREWTLDTIKTYIATGLDPEKSVLFIQSAIKEHAELFLLLSMITPVPRLERMPTYKDQKEQIKNRDLSNAGFLTYPVLMATDILMYLADGVPVGEDQIYHVEFTRELARRFNFTFKNEVFPEPKSIMSKVAKLPGTDGRKMSKSYDNFILIDNDSKSLWKKLAPMMTDPARVRRNDPGTPEKCPVWDYHKAFTSSQDELDWVYNGCKTAAIGCVDCKKKLHANIVEKMDPVWAKLDELNKNPDYLMNIINEGNEKARKIAMETMEKVRAATNIRW